MPLASKKGAKRPKEINPKSPRSRCAGVLDWERYQEIKDTLTDGDRLVIERMFEELRMRAEVKKEIT